MPHVETPTSQPSQTASRLVAHVPVAPQDQQVPLPLFACALCSTKRPQRESSPRDAEEAAIRVRGPRPQAAWYCGASPLGAV